MPEHVTDKKYERIKKTEFDVRCCPYCKGTADIIIHKPYFGIDRIVIKCDRCNFAIESNGPLRKTFCTETKLATPTTFNSLMTRIYQAVYCWNKESKNEINDVSCGADL